MPPRGGQQRIPRPPSHRPGRPAPWAHVDPRGRRLTLDEIRARLAVLPPGAAAAPRALGSVAAAVLVPLSTSEAWRRPRRVFDFSEIDAHQGLAILRQRARQAEPPGKRTGSHWRNVQAGAEGAVGQNLNGHRLFSSNEPAVIR